MVDREELQQAARIAASKHLVNVHSKLDAETLAFIVEDPENVWVCSQCRDIIYQEAMFEAPETLTQEELAVNNELSFAAAQPPPILPHVNLPNITELVKLDLERRAIDGEKKYGQRLKPHNGRDALIDAYQEAMDLTLYLRQKLFETYNR